MDNLQKLTSHNGYDYFVGGEDFLAYGYNDIYVVVKCTDSLNTINYLTSYETKYKSEKGNP